MTNRDILIGNYRGFIGIDRGFIGDIMDITLWL